MWVQLLWNAHKHQKAKICADEKQCNRIYIAVCEGKWCSPSLCLIHCEWEWAGKVTVMSVSTLYQKCSVLPITEHKLVKAFSLLPPMQKVVKRLFICCLCCFPFLSSALFFPLLLPQHLNSEFLLLSVTFKNCWSILAVHPTREGGWEWVEEGEKRM